MNTLNIEDYAVSELSLTEMSSIDGGINVFDAVRDAGYAAGNAVGKAGKALVNFMFYHSEQDAKMGATLMNCI